MMLSVSLFRAALLGCLVLALSGCEPAGQSQQEEEKEPHFLTGKSRVSSLDFPGAIEAFEKALEVNPHSASAHFELGWLYDQKEADPAAAIYHYDQYLKLRPNEPNAGLVKQRILSCKQDLARTVSLGPVTEKVQRDLEQLTADKQRLTDENKRLRDDIEKWSAYARSLQALTNRPVLQAAVPARANEPAPPARRTEPAAVPAAATAGATTPESSPPARTRPVAPPGLRTHTVASGETLAIIARRYGIRVDSLQAANPGVNPRRMRVGQTIVLPGSGSR